MRRNIPPGLPSAAVFRSRGGCPGTRASGRPWGLHPHQRLLVTGGGCAGPPQRAPGEVKACRHFVPPPPPARQLPQERPPPALGAFPPRRPITADRKEPRAANPQPRPPGPIAEGRATWLEPLRLPRQRGLFWTLAHSPVLCGQ